MARHESVPGTSFGYTRSPEVDGLVASMREREGELARAGGKPGVLVRRIVAGGVDAALALAEDESIGCEELLERCMGLKGEPAPGKETLPPERIEGAVGELLSFANVSDLPPEERAAIAKFSLEYIHPFRDGNDHVGRMLMCRMLTPEYSPITLLSFVAVLQGRRAEVSCAIADAVRTRSDTAPFARLMLDSLSEAQRRVMDSLDELSFSTPNRSFSQRRKEAGSTNREHGPWQSHNGCAK